MSYTIQQLFTRACSLIDSLKTDGTVDSTTTSDYLARTLTLVDMALKDLGRVADYYKVIEYSRNPVVNLLGDGFKVEAHEDEDITFESKEPCYSYYFESDSNGGTAYIEDYNGNWNIVTMVSLINSTDGFIAYSGNVTPTAGATKSRIRFSGSYYYNTVNRALFGFAFETGKIPVYSPYVNISLPTDLRRIDKVILESNSKYYIDPVYKIEWSGTSQILYVDYYYKGKIRVQYIPTIAVPTSMTDTVLIDDTTSMAVCYFLAYNFVANEQNESLTSLFKNEYERLRATSNIKQMGGFTAIVDYYGGI